MFFKKNNFHYECGNEFFTFNNEKVEFSNINAIYLKGTFYTTNSVYEKTDTVLTLRFQDIHEIELKADTRDLEEYKKLVELREAISANRYKKLHNEYLKNKTLVFSFKNDEYTLIFENKKLFVKYNKVKRPNSTDFEVKTIEQDGYIIKLKCDGEEEISSLWFISDEELFVRLAQEVVKYLTPFEVMQKKLLFKMKMYKYFTILFIPFGLNGFSQLWFQTSFFHHTEPIRTLSDIAGMLLSLWIIIAPVKMLIVKLNERKLQRESDFLAGRESSVKNFDFSNLMLVLLVCLLIFMIWKIL